MKSATFIISIPLFLMLYSCDPGFSVFIRNETNKTLTICSKTNSSQETSMHLGYLRGCEIIEADDTIRISSSIGWTNFSTYPIDSLYFIEEKDTLLILSKDSLVSRMITTRRAYYYTIK